MRGITAPTLGLIVLLVGLWVVRTLWLAGAFKTLEPFLSTALAREHIALEEVGNGVWNIVYYHHLAQQDR